MSKENFLNYIIDFAMDTEWENLKRREQLRALFTAWCFIYEIMADTKEYDDALYIVYEKVMMDPVIDYNKFETYMIELIV